MLFRFAAACAMSLSLALPALAADEAPVLSTVSPEEVVALMEGRETGLADLAEHHLWPSPSIVLKHAVELNLAPDQLAAAKSIEAELERDAKVVGAAWLDVAVDLEEAFRSGRASKGSVQALVMKAGELRAELQALQLIAHIKMRPYLTRDQLDVYGRLPAHNAHVGG